MEVFLPAATEHSALNAVIRLNAEAALARTGQWPASIDRDPGYEHSPGVMCWRVTFTTGVPPTQD